MMIGFAWLLLAGSVGCGFAARNLDARLQNFREAHVPPSEYRFGPARLRPELYHWSAARIVRRVWFYVGAMCLLGTLGGMLLVVETL